MKFKNHNIIKNKYLKLSYSFDTFRTPEGWDRIIKNCLRIVGIIGIAFLWNKSNIIFLPLIVLAVVFAGTTEFKFVRNKFKKLNISWWR